MVVKHDDDDDDDGIWIISLAATISLFVAVCCTSA